MFALHCHPDPRFVALLGSISLIVKMEKSNRKKEKKMKKLKLLLSVSVMCLSLAVLCFGVLAATSVTYSISGTISYTVSDAFVKVNTMLYKGTKQYTTDAELSALAITLEKSSVTTKLADGGFTADSITIDEYNSMENDSFSKTDLELKLTSTNPSYLVEMTIENLGDVNVWAKASWSSAVENIVQGNNTSQPTIEKDTPKKIYFIVSIAELETSITSTEYTMGLNIGINTMPTTATVDGETINSTYGTTWETFSQEEENIDVYTFDTSGYLMKNNVLMYYNNAKVSRKDTIMDGAVYEKAVYGVVLADDTNSQFYMNLGKTTEGEAIRWNMVSADGTTKYNSDNYATDKVNENFISNLSGKAIFLQETVAGGYVSYDTITDNQIVIGNENHEILFSDTIELECYFDSELRNGNSTVGALKNGNYYGLEQSDYVGIVKPRVIKEIAVGYCGYNGSETPLDGVSETKVVVNDDESVDYFWLLDVEEIEKFVGETNEMRVWSNSYWLRNSAYGYTTGVVCCYSTGILMVNRSNRMSCIRAAFQLA